MKQERGLGVSSRKSKERLRRAFSKKKIPLSDMEKGISKLLYGGNYPFESLKLNRRQQNGIQHCLQPHKSEDLCVF